MSLFPRFVVQSFLLILLTIVSEAKIDVLRVDAKGKPLKMKPDFKVVADSDTFLVVGQEEAANLKALAFKTTLSIKGTEKAKSVAIDSGKAKLSKGNIELELVSGESFLTVNLPSTDKLNFKIVRTFEASDIKLSECGPDFPDVQKQTESAPDLVIGIACLSRPGKPKSVVFSVPENVEIASSSFFDLQGKGERWRLYELPSSGSTGGVIGNVFVKIKNTRFRYDFISQAGRLESEKDQVISTLKVENKTLKQKLFMMTGENKNLTAKERSYLEKLASYLNTNFKVNFNLGYFLTNLSVDGGAALGSTSISSSTPIARLQADSRVFQDKYTFRLASATTLPVSADEKRVDYFSFDSQAGYLIKQGKLMLMPLLLASYKSVVNTKSGLTIQVAHFGVGGEAVYQMSDKNHLDFQFAVQTIGSNVLKSHSNISLGYKRVFEDSWTARVALESQTIGVVNSEGLLRKLSSTMIVLGVSL